MVIYALAQSADCIVHTVSLFSLIVIFEALIVSPFDAVEDGL
jgi:hypothetical protein